MIRIDRLTLRRGTKVLLADACVVLHPGDKAGLVGANGSGKSSLFALLRGELQPDQGDCMVPASWRIAHVAQDAPATQRSALDHVIDGDVRLRALQAELESHEASGERLGELHAMLADADGYTVQSRAETLLLGLGFTLEQTRWPVAHFSGGWRMRLNLAQALMCPSDLLLLDEPTNHLDLDAIVWLEQWLRRYPGTLIVISHDREFLDAVCTSIVHIERQDLRRYSGGYESFEKQRAEQLRQNQAAHARQQLEIAHLQRFVERFRAKASKARQAQSRVKMLERMELISPTYTASPFSFHFREPDAAPDPMLTMENLSCGYGGNTNESTDAENVRPILSDIDLTLRSGERIGLLGANGQGKSTFIKTLAGALPPLSGTLLAGKGLRIGYFAQHQIDTLRLDESPLRQLMRLAPGTREQELRNYLGGFDFKGDMATSAVAPFSGGEKARLALALIIWEKPNLLLLDEPTNHLDLETREALKVALAQFEGTLILVAHDRALLRATTDRFLLVANGHVQPFDGDLDEYRDWLIRQASQREIAAHGLATQMDGKDGKAASLRTPTEIAAPNDAGSTSRQEQRRIEAETRNARAAKRRPIEARIRRIEKELATLDSKRQTFEQQLADPVNYEAVNKEALRTLLFDQAVVAKQIGELESEWLACQEELERLAA